MIDRATLDRAYERSRETNIAAQMGVVPGELGIWLLTEGNLEKIIRAHGNDIRGVAVECIGIGILAAGESRN